jgi:ribosomal protein S12 methylthiotransferase accessory factor
MSSRFAPRRVSVAYARLQTLVSRHVGVVRGTYELLNAPDDARLVRIGCETADGTTVVGHPVSTFAGGAAESREDALAAALGEAAERYSAAYVPADALVVASADELAPEAVEPRRFALFSHEQHEQPGFPYVPFTPETRIPWVQGFTLPDGAPAYVPAELVYLARLPVEMEVFIGYPTSSGLACAGTLSEAVLGGLFELFERDAFMLTWSNRLSLPRLNWSRDEELLAFDRRYVAPTGLRLEVVDLSAFWNVPTALAVVHGARQDGCALAVGAASSHTARSAWKKAVSEAFAVRAWVRLLRQRRPDRVFRPDFADVATFDDHLELYASPERARWAAFLDASAETRDIREVEPLEEGSARGRTVALTRRLDARALSAYAVDVTSPDIADAGLHVARVVAPELCQLDVIQAARFLGGARLYRAAWELGLSAAPLASGELNPYPHPFP